MGFERSMDLTAEKKNDGGLTKYEFGLYIEIKEMRQKNDRGLTKYGFGFNKEIKGFGEEKSWGLNEVWIWLV